MDGNTLDADSGADVVARRAGNGRDDRALFASQTIEQARLADVGTTREHHVYAATQKATLPALVQHLVECSAHRYQPPRARFAVELIEFLLREIQLRLGQCAQFDQRHAKRLDRRREFPA